MGADRFGTDRPNHDPLDTDPPGRAAGEPASRRWPPRRPAGDPPATPGGGVPPYPRQPMDPPRPAPNANGAGAAPVAGRSDLGGGRRRPAAGGGSHRGPGGRPANPDVGSWPADLGPIGTLPPAPPDENVRLSIFEELQSEWFSRRRSARHSVAGQPPSAVEPWSSPADDGWRAAARLAEPTTAGTTHAGLPKRVPQALIVPGAVGSTVQPNGSPPVTRSPQEMRGRLSSYRDGVRRGRHSERGRADEGEL